MSDTDNTAADAAAAEATGTTVDSTGTAPAAPEVTQETQAPTGEAAGSTEQPPAEPSPETDASPAAEQTPAATPAVPEPAAEEQTPPPEASGVMVQNTSSPVGAPAIQADVTFTSAEPDPYLGTRFSGLDAETYSAEAQAVFKRIIETEDSLSINTVADILTYVKTMGPQCPHDRISGSRGQVGLYTALLNYINNAGDNFQLTWSVILRIVFEASATGAFQDHLCFRFFPDMGLDVESRTAFRNLLSIVTSTANASGRATALRQIDFQKALGQKISDDGKNRLLAYYNA
jgi:hypothetical protein